MMNDEIAKLFSLDTHFQIQASRAKKGRVLVCFCVKNWWNLTAEN
jgi:hypothetical protein